MKNPVSHVISAAIACAITLPASAGHQYFVNVQTSGPLTVNVAVTEHIMISGVEHVSATITVTGFANDNAIQGFIGTAATPWAVQTSAAGFYNAPSVAPFWNGQQPFAASPALGGIIAPHPPAYDSGLLPDTPFGPPNPFGTPSSEAGFGIYSDGSSETAAPWAWISINSAGVPVGPLSTVGVLRATWASGQDAWGSFVIAMNTPAISQDVHWLVTAIPTPGALMLLGIAGAARSRKRSF